MIETAEFVEIPKTYLFSPAEAAARELWARRFVTEFSGISRGLGYGVFYGGSLIRDIDLVAVPWRDGQKKLTHIQFVLELCHCLPLQMGNHGETLFGHRWYALWHTSHRDHQIDLKVMLPASIEKTNPFTTEQLDQLQFGRKLHDRPSRQQGK